MLSAPNQFVDDDSSPESSVYESTYESESVYESAIEESQSEGFLTPTLVLGSPPSTDSELWDDGTTINDGSTIQ